MLSPIARFSRLPAAPGRRSRLMLLLLALLAAAPAARSQAALELLDLSSAGVQADSDAIHPRLSADGRFAVFESNATNLVPGIINVGHVFLRDRLTGTTTIESVSTTGKKGNTPSSQARVSGDGRFVVFTSRSTNLVPPDVLGHDDVFLRDRVLGTTELVSQAMGGGPANDDSGFGAVSDDGRYVAFQSAAVDLVPGDVNGSIDVFLRDRLLGTTMLVTVVPGGGWSVNGGGEPQITPDGRWVAFLSNSLDLVGGTGGAYPEVMLRDLQVGVTTLVSVDPLGAPADSSSWAMSLSANGSMVAFASGADNLVAGDTNIVPDVFVRDLTSQATLRVSVPLGGGQASEPSAVYSDSLSISSDGTRVAFDTEADLLGDGTEDSVDVYVRDLATGLLECVSIAPGGVAGAGSSFNGALSRDGLAVAFQSGATSLVPVDANGPFMDALAGSQPALTWHWLGHALPGAKGMALLNVQSSLAPGSPGVLGITRAAPVSQLLLFASVAPVPVAFKGGTLLAVPWIIAVPLVTDAAGAVALPFLWPTGIPAGTSFVLQAAIADAAAPAGVALTNAVQGVTP